MTPLQQAKKQSKRVNNKCMIFKLTFNDRTEYAQAKNQLHLLQSYEKENGGFQEIEKVEEISEEEAKKIILKNPDYDEADPEDSPEWSLFDSVCGNHFVIVGSTDWQ